jgi:hypothetical protein
MSDCILEAPDPLLLVGKHPQIEADEPHHIARTLPDSPGSAIAPTAARLTLLALRSAASASTLAGA